MRRVADALGPLWPLFDIAAQAGGALADLCRTYAARYLLFGGLLKEISSLATGTVTVIEDVHWADEATIDLLTFLGRRISRSPALVVATYRENELVDDHPFRLVIGDLATQRGTRRMRLSPLSVDAVRALAGRRDVDAPNAPSSGGSQQTASWRLRSSGPLPGGCASTPSRGRSARCSLGAGAPAAREAASRGLVS